jgi:hypothetical protein
LETEGQVTSFYCLLQKGSFFGIKQSQNCFFIHEKYLLGTLELNQNLIGKRVNIFFLNLSFFKLKHLFFLPSDPKDSLLMNDLIQFFMLKKIKNITAAN